MGLGLIRNSEVLTFHSLPGRGLRRGARSDPRRGRPQGGPPAACARGAPGPGALPPASQLRSRRPMAGRPGLGGGSPPLRTCIPGLRPRPGRSPPVGREKQLPCGRAVSVNPWALGSAQPEGTGEWGGREVPSPADPGPPPGRGGRPWTPRTNTGEVRHRARGRERGPCSPEPLDFGVRPLLTTGRCRPLRARARGPGRSPALPLPRWPVTLTTLRHFFNLSELRVHFCQMEAIARPRGRL